MTFYLVLWTVQYGWWVSFKNTSGDKISNTRAGAERERPWVGPRSNGQSCDSWMNRDQQCSAADRSRDPAAEASGGRCHLLWRLVAPVWPSQPLSSVITVVCSPLCPSLSWPVLRPVSCEDSSVASQSAECEVRVRVTADSRMCRDTERGWGLYTGTQRYIAQEEESFNRLRKQTLHRETRESRQSQGCSPIVQRKSLCQNLW